ncbi:hypothetical protein B0H13DRAFT_2542791 [Mycena leptocephala]|nr:hypothetical protein B0H13DRAFT_2542791 [Mycena leptocephala]
MSTTTAPVTDTATSLPNAANAAASLPLTHTDTVILTPEPSVADVDVDLGAFFDNRPSASEVNATVSASTPIAPSLPPTPDHARPVLAGPMREFIDSVGLSDLPPKDKRFDGKVEVRQLGRELHSLTQQTARMHAELQKYRGESAQMDKKFHADIRRLQDLQANVATNTHDLATANDRLERVELSVNQTAATLTAIHEAVKTLTARFNAGALSSPAPSPAPPPVIPTPPPAVDDTLPDASASSIMIGLLQQLVAKRSRSPDAYDDARNVRTRVDTPFLAPSVVAPALPVAPAPIVAAAVAPALPVSPAPVLTAPVTTVPMAPAPVLATSTPITAAPVAPAPAPAPTTVSAPVAVGGANPPPALPAYDPAKEARLGPVSWGRNITGESATVIKTVLPSARAVMRNYRARRGPDQNTIVACFESAEIATWFIAAFNAARTSPYENVIASPNV